MATELQHSLLLQEESFFDFTDAPPSNSPVILLDNEDDNSLSSQRASDDNASEIAEFSDSDGQFDICSDKKNSEVLTDSDSKENCEVSYQKANYVNSSDITANYKACSWNELESSLQSVFPEDQFYTYVIEKYTESEQESFVGAPDHAFEVQVRVNVSDEIEAKDWVFIFWLHI